MILAAHKSLADIISAEILAARIERAVHIVQQVCLFGGGHSRCDRLCVKLVDKGNYGIHAYIGALVHAYHVGYILAEQDIVGLQLGKLHQRKAFAADARYHGMVSRAAQLADRFAVVVVVLVNKQGGYLKAYFLRIRPKHFRELLYGIEAAPFAQQAQGHKDGYPVEIQLTACKLLRGFKGLEQSELENGNASVVRFKHGHKPFGQQHAHIG